MSQLRKLAVLAIAATSLIGQYARANDPASQERDFQIVQQVDDVIYGVDRLSLELVGGGRYVYAVVLAQRLSATKGEPSADLWQGQYLVECLETPKLRTSLAAPVRGVAVAIAPADGPPDFGSKWLDGTRNAADFACRAIQELARAPRIAQEVREDNGPRDTKALTCTVANAHDAQNAYTFDVRFSDSEGIATMYGVWLRSASVTTSEVRLIRDGNYRWRVDRRSGEIIMDSLARPDLGVLGRGKCEVVSAVKKF